MAGNRKQTSHRHKLRSDPDDRFGSSGGGAASKNASRKHTKRKRKSRTQEHFLQRAFFGALKWSCKWGFVALIWMGIGLMLTTLFYIHDLPDIKGLGNQERKQSITIVDQNGIVLAKYGDLFGDYLEYNELPRSLIDAVLATEDRRFFDHIGIDIIGILRAAYTNYRANRIVQGGSTITQQLAKILFLTPDRTFERKIQEVFLALWIEQYYSKEEILTIYLNRVYLGAGNYGVDAASRYYFGKPVTEVNLQEAAMIAGLLKAPSRYAPNRNPTLAKQRAHQVLLNMVSANFITLADILNEDYTPPKIIKAGRGALENLYFADWIMEQVPDYVANSKEDLTVVTTLNLEYQHMAEAAVQAKMADAQEQVAFVSLSPDGEVLAMVGGKDYRESQFNRAVAALRQPGSSFKLFVYLAALEHGLLPDDTRLDEPITIQEWQPRNYNDEYKGDVTLRHAFAKSINTISVSLAQEVGIGNVIQQARKMGISSDIERNLSIALGSSAVSLIEMVGSYAHLANNGNAVWVHGIKEIHGKDNNILYKRAEPEPIRVVSEKATVRMNDLMMAVLNGGTGRVANMNRPAAGKTGTSQDFRDAWFIGFTPDMVAGVWVGNDDNSPMETKTTGGGTPARIWRRYMEASHKDTRIRRIATTIDQLHRNERHTSGGDSFWDTILSGLGRSSVEYEYPQ